MKNNQQNSYEIMKLKKSIEIAKKLIAKSEDMEVIKDLKLGIKEMRTEINKLGAIK